MTTATTDTSKTWTVAEYQLLDENPNQQLIDGKLIMSPSPLLIHQRVSGKVFSLLLEYATKNNDLVFYAPLDVFLDQQNVPQPDIVYLLKESEHKLSEKGINGAPDLIVEIISPSNSYLDRYDKKKLYEKHGVKEYWILDPGNKTGEFYSLESANFVLHQYLSEQGAIESKLLKELSIQVEDFFR